MALITRDNFSDAAARLEAELERCAFAAIDCEMTGIFLGSDENTKPTLNDTTASRYAKCARVASRFQLMQVGVCPFRAREDGTGYVSTPFTFYVLPDAKANAPLLMYTSTASFHAGNNFDFNAWLKGGVSFLSESTYESLAARLTDRAAESMSERPKRDRVVLTHEADRSFFETAIGELRAWLDANRHAAATVALQQPQTEPRATPA